MPREGLVSRFLFLAVLAGLVYGGWVFLENYHIEGLDRLEIRPRDGASRSIWPTSILAPRADRKAQVIRICSFNIQVLGRSKLSKQHVAEKLVGIIRQFDVVAVQEIRDRNPSLLADFVDLVNRDGHSYEYVLGPRLGRTSSKEQYAFIYDATRIEMDPDSVYTIEDPDDFLHRPPLIALFRVRGPPPDEAFTFKLVNVHTDPDDASQELNALDEVYRAVRTDHRSDEDDIIILGDLNADDQHLGELGRIPGMACAVSGIPTNTRRSEQLDNILYHSQATSEYTGRHGVLNMMREFNLSLALALEVSDHCPIWAEFSAYEDVVGRVASRMK